jgi:hypothetical protein
MAEVEATFRCAAVIMHEALSVHHAIMARIKN